MVIWRVNYSLALLTSLLILFTMSIYYFNCNNSININNKVAWYLCCAVMNSREKGEKAWIESRQEVSVSFLKSLFCFE